MIFLPLMLCWSWGAAVSIAAIAASHFPCSQSSVVTQHGSFCLLEVGLFASLLNQQARVCYGWLRWQPRQDTSGTFANRCSVPSIHLITVLCVSRGIGEINWERKKERGKSIAVPWESIKVQSSEAKITFEFLEQCWSEVKCHPGGRHDPGRHNKVPGNLVLKSPPGVVCFMGQFL